MSGRVAILAACLIAVLVGRAHGADVASEKEKLQGTWKSYSYEGTSAVKNSKVITLVIEGDYVHATINLDNTKFALDLDKDATPKEIDLTPMIGLYRDVDHVNKGIYSIDGDELTVCIGGETRPTRFEIRTKQSDALFKLKRERK